MKQQYTISRNLRALFGFLLFSSAGLAQPYAVGHQSATWNDASRNRNIDVEIYYPSDTAGDDVPLPAAPGQFPAVAFGHGFVMGYDAYLYLRDLMVPEGFILIFPKTEGGILPSHLDFGKDLAFCLQHIKSMGTGSGSLYSGRVAGPDAVMGHSMGGGAAFLAAGLDPEISAIAVLSPAETNPSAIAASATVSVPALVLAGSNDCVSPPDANQQPMYQGLASVCKTYISITGGSHCQMADSNFLCGIGEATCSPSPAISREAQHAVIATYLLRWLKAHLAGNCASGNEFDSLLGADASVTFEKTCVQCSPLSVSAPEKSDFLLFPNPTGGSLTVTLPSPGGTLLLFDMQGRKMMERPLMGEVSQIDVSALSAGGYLYTIIGDKSSKKGTLVKL